MKSSLLVCLLVLPICECMKTAIVVGAGPSGLATALVLSKRHGYDVTVLEAAESIDVYDPTKAYPFLIRERGQKLTKLFPSLQKALEEKGVAAEGPTQILSVPADPEEILDTAPKPVSIAPASIRRDFWIRRHEFNRILLDAAAEEDKITVVLGAKCKSVSATSDSVIEICTQEGDKSTKTYKTSFLVAADGMKSTVRESLAESPSRFPGWRNNRPGGFKIKRWFSPASGLKFKVCAQVD
jgi:2-polyprenyl-6-methoxyphenol hydroxylase-like FAD-dependent oxidoreductase